MIYLDNNASTRVATEVLQTMLPFLQDLYGNASATCQQGDRLSKNVADASAALAALLNCRPDELIFTSGGTEANNLALRGIIEAPPAGKFHVVTTAVEHPSVREALRRLVDSEIEVTELAVDRNGMIDPAQVQAALTSRTRLISIMFANNETGVLFPIADIAEIARRKGVVFHVDASQAVGRIPIDLAQLGIDVMSISGHKFHAPQGIGALFVRDGVRLQPQLLGGGQQRGRRSGTLPVALIVGLGRAALLASEQLFEDNQAMLALRERLEQGVLASFPGAIVHGDRARRLPNTASIGFPFVEAEGIVRALAQLGICVSSGAACAAGSEEPSHVLTAMGVPMRWLHGSLRFSLSRYSTQAEIDEVLHKLPRAVGRSSKA